MVERLPIEIEAESLKELCRRWRIQELSVFGSVLWQEFRPDSDVDVLVSFEPDAPWSLFDLVRLKSELEALIGRRVDLVERDALENPFRRREILRTKRTLYAA